MHRIRLAIAAVIMIVASVAIGVRPDSASAACKRGPYDPPSLPCFNMIFGAGELVYVDIHLPFVWIRSQPGSNGSIVSTIRNPGKYGVLRSTSFDGSWDGYQWWWPVELSANPAIHGWIEEASIGDTGEGQLAVPQPSDPSLVTGVNWGYFASVRLKANIPFAWIRYLPGSPKILAVVGPASRFILFGTLIYPYFDGYQWWWPVQVDTFYGVRNGWVEQNSLMLR